MQGSPPGAGREGRLRSGADDGAHTAECATTALEDKGAFAGAFEHTAEASWSLSGSAQGSSGAQSYGKEESEAGIGAGSRRGAVSFFDMFGGEEHMDEAGMEIAEQEWWGSHHFAEEGEEESLEQEDSEAEVDNNGGECWHDPANRAVSWADAVEDAEEDGEGKFLSYLRRKSGGGSGTGGTAEVLELLANLKQQNEQKEAQQAEQHGYWQHRHWRQWAWSSSSWAEHAVHDWSQRVGGADLRHSKLRFAEAAWPD